MNRPLVGIAVVLLLTAPLLMAQGQSLVRVTSISINPTTVMPGGSATVTVGLQNGSNASYGCATFNLVVRIFKDTETSANQVWQTTQSLAPFSPNEARTVQVTARWSVPQGEAPDYHVVAWSPVCAPQEFPQGGSLTLRRNTTYSAPATMVQKVGVVPRLP